MDIDRDSPPSKPAPRKRRPYRRRGSFIEIILFPFFVVRGFFWRIRYGIGSVFSSLMRSSRQRRQHGGGRVAGWFGILGHLILFPFVMIFSGLWELFVTWTSSRRLKGLLLGCPAVVAAAVAIGIIVWANGRSKSRWLGQYESAAVAAVNAKNYDAASIYYSRLISLSPSEQRFRYQLGRVEQARGNERRSAELIGSLTALDGTGYPPANLWYAGFVFTNTSLSREQQVQTSQRYLAAVLKSSPDNLEANVRMARLLSAQGLHREAIPFWERVAARVVGGWNQVAYIQKNLSENASVQHYLKLEQQRCEQLLKQNLRNVAAWQALGTAKLIADEFPAAYQIFERGFKQTTDQRLQAQLAEALALWSQWLEKEKGDSEPVIAQRLQLLEGALKHAPNQRLAITQLEKLGQAKGKPEQREQVRQMLTKQLAAGNSPASVHFLLGVMAVHDDNLDRALFHFEQSKNLNPSYPLVLNNLAWIKAHRDPDETTTLEQQLDEALRLVNAAIEINGNILQFYDTRGQILVKLQRYSDALPDLERALTKMSDNIPLREALVQVYRALDMPQIADDHQKFIDQLKEQQGNTSPTSNAAAG